VFGPRRMRRRSFRNKPQADYFFESVGANNQDVAKVKRTLTYLVHGSGDFIIQRLHDVLYDPLLKLGYFGRFCALELYRTIKPEECPEWPHGEGASIPGLRCPRGIIDHE
jgi:hypothetical protein